MISVVYKRRDMYYVWEVLKSKPERLGLLQKVFATKELMLKNSNGRFLDGYSRWGKYLHLNPFRMVGVKARGASKPIAQIKFHCFNKTTGEKVERVINIEFAKNSLSLVKVMDIAKGTYLQGILRRRVEFCINYAPLQTSDKVSYSGACLCTLILKAKALAQSEGALTSSFSK